MQSLESSLRAVGHGLTLPPPKKKAQKTKKSLTYIFPFLKFTVSCETFGQWMTSGYPNPIVGSGTWIDWCEGCDNYVSIVPLWSDVVSQWLKAENCLPRPDIEHGKINSICQLESDNTFYVLSSKIGLLRDFTLLFWLIVPLSLFSL